MRVSEGPEHVVVMDKSDTDEPVARVAAVSAGAAEIGARQNADRGIPPEPDRGVLAVADLQPQEKAAGGTVEAGAAVERPLGQIDLGPIAIANRHGVRLVGPKRRGGRQDRQWRGAGCVGAQPLHHRDDGPVAGNEAGAQACRVRALGQAVEDDDVGEGIVAVGTERDRGLQRAGRRRLVPDVGIAFVDGQHEAMATGQADRRLEVIEAGDRPFGIGGRAEVEQRRAVQEIGVELIEIG